MKLYKTLICLIFAAPILLIYSCAPLYVPNAINAPLMSNKGEIHANLSAGSNGFDLMTSGAVTDHFAIMANGEYQNRDNVDSNSTDLRQHTFGEVGFGYYTKLNEKARFEVFGGGGYGTAASYMKNAGVKFRAQGEYYRLFLQPNIGMSSDVFDGAFSMRLGYVRLFNFNKDYADLSLSPSTFLIEPAATIRVGYKYVKFFFQVGASFKTDKNFYSETWNPIFFNLGAHLTFGKKWEI